MQSAPPCKWVRCPADGHGQGYSHTTLRSDIAPSYVALYDAVRARGGILTSSGGRRALSSPATAGRSKTSLHYTGRAFDLFVYSGGFAPNADPYLLQLDEETGAWRVLAWVVDPDAPLAPKQETVTKVLRITQSGGGMRRRSKWEWVPVTARCFDFTALAAEHGFTPIPARDSFMQGGSYSGAEWWHFENRTDLLPTFGEELLQLYSEREIQIQFPYLKALGTALR